MAQYTSTIIKNLTVVEKGIRTAWLNHLPKEWFLYSEYWLFEPSCQKLHHGNQYPFEDGIELEFFHQHWFELRRRELLENKLVLVDPYPLCPISFYQVDLRAVSFRNFFYRSINFASKCFAIHSK